MVLDPPPARTRKCPECREAIVVRTRRGQKVYLTEAGAKAFERDRAREVLRNKAIRAVENIGLDRGVFERKEQELREQMPGSGPHDVFWALANERAHSFMKDQVTDTSWHGLSRVYFQQALWLSRRGQPYWQLKTESAKAQARTSRLSKRRSVVRG